ncbi:MAG: DNA-binding protein [Nanohaloarchaea archaeon SW_7_43_1]|nr:MAG: DNA-binding protein [Nanohaloarchaea archaeon SW_7_43_1]
MKLVADSNILISAFISDSTTRQLVKDLEAEIYAPDKLKEEVGKYDDLIQNKSNLTERELEHLKNRLFDHVNFIETERLEPYQGKASETIGNIDPDDAIFIAAALAINATIWSDDTDLQQQDQVPILTTTELLDLLER